MTSSIFSNHIQGKGYIYYFPDFQISIKTPKCVSNPIFFPHNPTLLNPSHSNTCAAIRAVSPQTNTSLHLWQGEHKQTQVRSVISPSASFSKHSAWFSSHIKGNCFQIFTLLNDLSTEARLTENAPLSTQSSIPHGAKWKWVCSSVRLIWCDLLHFTL